MPLLFKEGEAVGWAHINMRHLTTSLNASLPFFIKQKWLDCKDCFASLPHADAHTHIRFLGHTYVPATFCRVYTPTQDTRSIAGQDGVVHESCLLYTWRIRRFPHTYTGAFFFFLFFFLPCSNKWQNQWCTVIQQCNSFHWLWLLARSAICLWLSLSPSLSLSLSFAWICPTFRNITCLPSLSYARGTTPVSPPFRRGVLWVRRHLGYSTSVSWEEKGKEKIKKDSCKKKKKIDIYIMFWDPIAPASAFYPKPWDGSASSRNFSCFIRASSFSLSDTGTPRQCKPPWNACCWTLAGLCHQTTSCIGNRGTPLGSYASLLFEAAEKWIIN